MEFEIIIQNNLIKNNGSTNFLSLLTHVTYLSWQLSNYNTHIYFGCNLVTYRNYLNSILEIFLNGEEHSTFKLRKPNTTDCCSIPKTHQCAQHPRGGRTVGGGVSNIFWLACICMAGPLISDVSTLVYFVKLTLISERGDCTLCLL